MHPPAQQDLLENVAATGDKGLVATLLRGRRTGQAPIP